ncbi:unnamed protein product [Prorocentrum cordatum]|uniref:Uncharacterized protein n=1 Tax=Prorocentrum cordatum TaxID=2364126 RepID=A0ABN9VS16_9DINO|nr:unnamed protein product [Polarella glacialis]
MANITETGLFDQGERKRRDGGGDGTATNPYWGHTREAAAHPSSIEDKRSPEARCREHPPGNAGVGLVVMAQVGRKEMWGPSRCLPAAVPRLSTVLGPVRQQAYRATLRRALAFPSAPDGRHRAAAAEAPGAGLAASSSLGWRSRQPAREPDVAQLVAVPAAAEAWPGERDAGQPAVASGSPRAGRRPAAAAVPPASVVREALLRSALACASPGCGLLVNSRPELGGYCCVSCSRGGGVHEPRCEGAAAPKGAPRAGADWLPEAEVRLEEIELERALAASRAAAAAPAAAPGPRGWPRAAARSTASEDRPGRRGGIPDPALREVAVVGKGRDRE